MDVEADRASHSNPVRKAGELEVADFSFLPKRLFAQCQGLIESFHDLHGYSCLPDIMWKAGLGPFVETNGQLQQLLRKASTTRSAKKSSAGFVRIAATILSLEILASRFAGWNKSCPREAAKAREILEAISLGRRHPLIEFYLYPPKYPNSAAIAALAPPRGVDVGDVYGASTGDAGHGETPMSQLEPT